MINTVGPRKDLSAMFTLLLFSHQEPFPHYGPPPRPHPQLFLLPLQAFVNTSADNKWPD